MLVQMWRRQLVSAAPRLVSPLHRSPDLCPTRHHASADPRDNKASTEPPPASPAESRDRNRYIAQTSRPRSAGVRPAPAAMYGIRGCSPGTRRTGPPTPSPRPPHPALHSREARENEVQDE